MNLEAFYLLRPILFSYVLFYFYDSINKSIARIMGVSDCLRMMSWMNSSRRSGNEAKDAPELSGKWLTMACQNRFVCHKRKMMFTWNNAPVKDVASGIIAGLRKANAPNLLTPSRQCWRMLSDACLPRRSTSDDARRRHDELFRNILVRLHHYALISQLMWFTGFLHEQFQARRAGGDLVRMLTRYG